MLAQNEVLLCIDCRWHEKAICKHFHLIDLVDGSQLKITARSQRYGFEADDCGKDAKYFEEKSFIDVTLG